VNLHQKPTGDQVICSFVVLKKISASEQSFTQNLRLTARIHIIEPLEETLTTHTAGAKNGRMRVSPHF